MGFLAELQLVEFRIETTGGQQLLVGAAFNDTAVFNDEDGVRSPDRGEAVSDHNRGFALDEPVDSIKDQFL